MSDIILHAQRRDQTGKQYAKKARRSGEIPGVLYGPGEEPVVLSVEVNELKKVLHTAGETTVISLLLAGNGKKQKKEKVIIRKVQLHPVTQEYLNVDLQHVSMKTKVTVEIPIVIEGTAKGTKAGGILEHVLHALKIECLPSDIPEHIQVDVSELDIGNSVHVEDLEIGKARVLTDSTSSVVTILPPVVIKEPVEEVEEEIEEAVEGEEKEEEAEREKEESKQEE